MPSNVFSSMKLLTLQKYAVFAQGVSETQFSMTLTGSNDAVDCFEEICSYFMK